MILRLSAVVTLCGSLVLGATQTPKLLSLDDALKTADQNQPNLRAAHANTNAARARIGEARAAYLPQLNLTAQFRVGTGGFLNRAAPDFGSDGGIVNGAAGTSSYGVNGLTVTATGSQLIYDFNATLDKIRAQGWLADAQYQTERTQLEAIRFAVRTAYFNARAQKSLVQVAKDTLANENKHLAQVQGFVNVGTQPEIALAQEKTTQANAVVQLINAQNNYETSKAQLNQQMGVEQDTDYDVEEVSQPPIQGEEGDTDTLMGEALQGRPEYLTLAREVKAQDLVVGSTIGQFFPSFSVAGGITDLATVPYAPYTAFGEVTMSWNFFSGLGTLSTKHEAEATLASYKFQQDAEKLQVRLDVEQARLAVRADKAALAASDQALLNAKEQLRLAEGRYVTGVGSIIELGDAQVALTTAAAQRVQADYTLSTARAQLIKALGRD